MNILDLDVSKHWRWILVNERITRRAITRQIYLISLDEICFIDKTVFLVDWFVLGLDTTTILNIKYLRSEYDSFPASSTQTLILKLKAAKRSLSLLVWICHTYIESLDFLVVLFKITFRIYGPYGIKEFPRIFCLKCYQNRLRCIVLFSYITRMV